jgi:hypothetical protein
MPHEMTCFQRAFGEALTGDPGSIAGGPLARALAVHRNTAAKAACDALGANYPVLRALAGEEAFAGWALDYVRLKPPSEPRLNTFGDGFEAFLTNYGATRTLPYLSDVAAVERCVTEALFATDAPPLDVDQAGRALSARSKLRLHPATRFRQFASPAASIWLAHAEPGADALESIDWAAEAALVTRPHLAVQVRVVDLGAIAFLNACASGASLSDAAGAADLAGVDLAALLPALMGAGTFAREIR